MSERLSDKKNRYLISGGVILLLGILFVIYTARSRNVAGETVEDERFLLNTLVSIRLYDSRNKDILEEAFSLIECYENQLSRHIGSSEISRINAAGPGIPVSVSETTLGLLETALDYAGMSGGSFDPTVGPLVDLWRIGSDKPHLPDPGEISRVLPLVDFTAVTVDRITDSVSLNKPGMALDLGGISKGWIADRVGEFLIENGETHFIVNLGGNILVHGGRPEGKSGSRPFRIGMQNPFDSRGNYLGVFTLSEGSVVSSGIYERYFESGGKRYHHILSTVDGYPVENGLAGVTVLSEKSIDGDALSTTLFTLGLEKGMKLAESLKGIEAAFVTKEGDVISTPGAAERYTAISRKND